MSDTHILIVDDDTRLRALLAAFFRRHGYLVSSARDGAHARRLLAGLAFDIIIMDVMMPGEDGISLCASVRKEVDAPLILLTARSETSDRIAGLEAGADDYLSKPFDPKELLLRVGAILRRRPDVQHDEAIRKSHVQFGPYSYDPSEGMLVCEGAPVRLTATEGQLLALFCANPGMPLTRDYISRSLGRGEELGQERAIDVQITRLRKKLEDDPKSPQFLLTVRGEGYVLVCK